MKFVVHDTVTTMAGIVRLPLEQRPDALREMLAPIRQFIPMPGDIIDIHHQGGGFRVDADDPRYAEALARLAEQDVLGQVERELERASAALSHLKQGDTVQVMFVLGNPDDEHLMTTTGGYFGMGSAPGWLYLLAWPDEQVIGRIAHCAVHELHHQIRYTNVEWIPDRVTVGEHVISEGLAEAFVRELSGPEAMGPWSSMVTGADFDRAYELIMADFGLRGMWNTPAYVLGDSAARRFGQEPRGIPDMAGYAVGLKLVDRALAETGRTVAELSGLPVEQIVQPGETNPDS
jgi:uncharacterized protein YjaZ